MMKRFLPFTLFLCLTLALALMLSAKNRPATPGMAETRPFPAITVTSMDGKKQWEPAITNGKVTLVNFFASWCTPCAAEMPELSDLKKKFPDLQMIGIAWNDAPETLQKWLKKHGNSFDSVWFDSKGDATMDLGIKGIPETFLIDAKGMIRYHVTGPITEQLRIEEYDALIEALSGEAANAR